MAFQNDFLDFNDFSRLAYDKVFLNADIFEETLIIFCYFLRQCRQKLTHPIELFPKSTCLAFIFFW